MKIEIMKKNHSSNSDERESNFSERNSDISTSTPASSDWKLCMSGAVFTKTEKKGTVALF
jgi:hypothetical protein